MRTLAVLSAIALGAGAASAVTDLDDPNEPWRHQTVGVTTDVPPPFEPLSLDGSQASCWGRTYTLGTHIAPQPTIGAFGPC